MNLTKLTSAIAIMALSAITLSANTSTDTVKVVSPNGKLGINVWMKNNSPVYNVTFKGKEVILESKMGIISNGNWAANAQIKNVTTSSNNTSWKPVYGERSIYQDNYNQTTINLQNDKNKKLDIVVRAYNEGVAFRYIFAGTSSYIHVTDELTEFTVPEGTMGYYTPRAQSKYVKMAIDPAVWGNKQSERPLTLELPDGTFLSLGEAEMVDYARTKFVVEPKKKARSDV